MNIPGFNSNSGNQHTKITEDDRHWVEENFRWLKEIFGYPNRASGCYGFKMLPAAYEKILLQNRILPDYA